MRVRAVEPAGGVQLAQIVRPVAGETLTVYLPVVLAESDAAPPCAFLAVGEGVTVALPDSEAIDGFVSVGFEGERGTASAAPFGLQEGSYRIESSPLVTAIAAFFSVGAAEGELNGAAGSLFESVGEEMILSLLVTASFDLSRRPTAFPLGHRGTFAARSR